jgi:hypothetical protein
MSVIVEEFIHLSLNHLKNKVHLFFLVTNYSYILKSCDVRTKSSIILGILTSMVIGLQMGVHVIYATQLTTSSYTDGYSKGVRDAGRDLQGLNGHGYNSSCPSGHTSVFCSAYVRGYDNTWYAQRQNSPPPFPQSESPSSDWTLTVRPVNVPFGDSTIHISVKGPFGYTNFHNIHNSQFPSTRFDMPGDQFPTGYRYQVCASSSALGIVLPHCQYFIHGQGDRQVVITPQ